MNAHTYKNVDFVINNSDFLDVVL